MTKSFRRMVVRRKKRTQHCTFCKNHGLKELKKGHQCSYSECPCLLCKLTKKAQVAMRHQQRVWRHQKQKLKNQTEEESSVAGEKSSKGQACDKCRNHNIIKPKKNHECPFHKCDCEYCSLTYKRREIMKHQQRVRRSRIMSQIESESSRSPAEKPVEDEHEEEDIGINIFHCEEGDVDGTRHSPIINSPARGDFTIDVSSPRESPSQLRLHKTEDAKDVEPLQNLSVQFSSLESEYSTTSEVPKAEMNIPSPAESNICIPSPPPLLPIDVGQHCYDEEDLASNKSVDHHYPYGYLPVEYDPVQREKDLYHEAIRFPQEAPTMESSQISTVMLFQNGYSSALDPHPYATPQHLQQTASSIKIAVDQLMNPSAVCGQLDEYLYRNQSRYNPADLSSPFSNFSQASAMILHEQRQHHFQRRQREHPVRLPYFNFPGTNQ